MNRARGHPPLSEAYERLKFSGISFSLSTNRPIGSDLPHHVAGMESRPAKAPRFVTIEKEKSF
jgi:hypothetical protein